jgi:hypothetical protein
MQDIEIFSVMRTSDIHGMVGKVHSRNVWGCGGGGSFKKKGSPGLVLKRNKSGSAGNEM